MNELSPAARAAVERVNVRTHDTGAFFVSIPEAARRLGLSEGTGRTLARTGRLRTIPYGSRKLVPIDAIAELAAELMSGAV